MRYHSRKFSKVYEKEELLLYFMSVVALVQLFYLVMHKKYKFIIIFFALGIILSFFVRDQSMVLLMDILAINILLYSSPREGLTNNTKPVAPALPIPTEPDTKNKAHKKSVSGVSKNATSVAAPTTLKPKESFDTKKNGQIEQVGNHIEALSNLMDKFSGLTKKFGLGN